MREIVAKDEIAVVPQFRLNRRRAFREAVQERVFPCEDHPAGDAFMPKAGECGGEVRPVRFRDDAERCSERDETAGGGTVGEQCAESRVAHGFHRQDAGRGVEPGNGVRAPCEERLRFFDPFAAFARAMETAEIGVGGVRSGHREHDGVRAGFDECHTGRFIDDLDDFGRTLHEVQRAVSVRFRAADGDDGDQQGENRRSRGGVQSAERFDQF